MFITLLFLQPPPPPPPLYALCLFKTISVLPLELRAFYVKFRGLTNFRGLTKSKPLILLFGEEMIVRSSIFKQRIAYVELKRQICPKVVNNYDPYPKVLIKPYDSSLVNYLIFNN